MLQREKRREELILSSPTTSTLKCSRREPVTCEHVQLEWKRQRTVSLECLRKAPVVSVLARATSPVGATDPVIIRAVLSGGVPTPFM